MDDGDARPPRGARRIVVRRPRQASQAQTASAAFMIERKGKLRRFFRALLTIFILGRGSRPVVVGKSRSAEATAAVRSAASVRYGALSVKISAAPGRRLREPSEGNRIYRRRKGIIQRSAAASAVRARLGLHARALEIRTASAQKPTR